MNVAAVAASLGTVLGVWAHPDDEVYLSGGLMAAAVDAGARVACVTATMGEHGTADPAGWPPGRLAAVRRAELATSLAVLGVTEHHQLGYPEGGCAGVPAGAAADRLAAVIDDVRPGTVLTFGPDGATGHPDHRAVSAWVAAAVRRTRRSPAPRVLHAAKTAAWCERFAALNRDVGAFQPGLPRPVAASEVAFEVVLPDALLDRKVAALLAQASQVAPLVAAIGRDAFRDWVAVECFAAAADRLQEAAP